MKKMLLATTALAVSGVAGQALAVDVELYGQVNKALAFTDDSSATDFSVVDNDVSSTRFGLKGSQALEGGLTASVLLETEIQDNPSNSVTQNTTTNQSSAAQDPAAASFATRHARVGLAGDFGAVFIGRQSTATDSVTEQDLAGVGDLMYSASLGDLMGGYKVRTTTANQFVSTTLTSAAAGSATTIGALAGNMDGNGRANAIRYDSPIFNGFQARGSVVQGGDVDIAGYYSGKYDALTVKAAVGYVMYNDLATTTSNILESQLSGSVTVGHENGLAGTLALGKQSLENKGTGIDAPSFMYGKVGYSWDAFEVAVDYGTYEDALTVAKSHEIKTLGLGGQYNLGNGVSVAASYRTAEVDVANTGTAVNTEDLSQYTMSLRVKF